MRTALYSVLLVLSAWAAGAAPDAPHCQNPVFADTRSWGAPSRMPAQLPLAQEPLPFPTGAGACLAYEGKTTCCSNATLEAIEHAFDTARTVIEEAQSVMRNMTFDLFILRSMQAVCELVHCPASVRQVLTKYTTLLPAASKRIVDAQMTCSLGLLAYSEGMACFACAVDFHRYLNASARRMIIAEATCDAVMADCQPVFAAAINLLQTTMNFLREFMDAFAGGHIPAFPFNFDNLPDMCGGTARHPGDCRNHLCFRMLNGFTIPMMQWNLPLLAQPQAMQLPAGEDVPTAVEKHVHAVARRAVAALSSPSSTQLAADASHAQYAKDGYDAYAVGCSNPRTSCPTRTAPSGGLPGWAVAVIIIACCALVAVGALYIRHRRMYYTAMEGLPLVRH